MTVELYDTTLRDGAQMEGLSQAQESGFAALAEALAEHGNRLDELLGEVLRLGVVGGLVLPRVARVEHLVRHALDLGFEGVVPEATSA